MKYQCVNEEIVEQIVQLVMEDGSMRGQVPKYIAMNLAEEKELDLVQVSPAHDGKPPICKLMDYGKIKYKDAKSKKNKNRGKIVVKEIKFGFNISEHDMETKMKKVFKCLSKRYHVKFTLEVRGRYRYMKDIAIEKMNKQLEKLEGLAKWGDIIEENDLTVILKPVGK